MSTFPFIYYFSSRRRHTRWPRDWSSDVCSSDLLPTTVGPLPVDSMLRLDELQSVFTPHLQPTQCSLGDEATEILRGQFQYLISRSEERRVGMESRYH